MPADSANHFQQPIKPLASSSCSAKSTIIKNFEPKLSLGANEEMRLAWNVAKKSHSIPPPKYQVQIDDNLLKFLFISITGSIALRSN